MEFNFKMVFTGIVALFNMTIFNVLISCDNDSAGPCLHIYEEPILKVRAVRDLNTREDIDRIELNQVKIDNADADFKELLDQSANVTGQDTRLICDVPCSFGTQEGEYSFVVSAVGYRDSLYTLNVNYKYSEGGCPSRSWGSQEIEIELARQ